MTPALVSAGTVAGRFVGLLLALAALAPAVHAQGTGSMPASVPVSVSKPQWSELTAGQREALMPLSTLWDGLSEGHKRKWIALSSNYTKLDPAGQSTLHSRMSDWASLSFQQRAQARLNFAEIKRLAAEERKAKWEAYQALSDDERNRLVRRAGTSPSGAAMAVRPVPAQKLAPLPAVSGAAERRTPRIELAPRPLPTQPAVLSSTPPADTPTPLAPNLPMQSPARALDAPAVAP